MMDRAPDRTSREARFTAFFEANYGRLLAFARRRVDPSVAQDIVAETFLKAWRRFDDHDTEATTWLYSIARGEIANVRRGRARRSALAERLRLMTLATNPAVTTRQ